MMNGEEIRFCFKCEVSFSTCEDLSEHSCNTLNPDTSDKKNEKEHVVSKNEFNPDMTSVESKPVTTFKKLYECHRKRFPNVKVTSSNREFKETSAICLQELLQLDKKDILENEIFWKEIQNFVDHVPLYLPNHYKKKKGNSGPGNRYRIFKAHKYFYEREFNILPSNNSSLIYEEIEGNPEVNDNEIHLDMSCDEIRPHTSYKKLFQHHRSRFPNVRVGYQKEFKETSEICLQELLQLDKKDILKNEKFQQKIKGFIIYAPRYWKKKNCSRNKMFAAYKQFFEHEFTILNISHANKSDKSCETVINDVSNDVSNDISNDVSNDMSNDVSYKFINDELELHPDLVLSSEELDKIENNIEKQTLGNGFKLDVSEKFLSKILKTVDELCDDIKDGDPDFERMLGVNLNLNNAVSCYQKILSLKKQNCAQKKNQELVNHKTREIIQPYECDDEDIDCISKDVKGHQIPKSLENYGQTASGAEKRFKHSEHKTFKNLQSASEGNGESRKRKRHSVLSEEVLESRNTFELKRLKYGIVVNCDDKKLENGMDSFQSNSETRLFNSGDNYFYNELIEKQFVSKDQLINQDSGNVPILKTKKMFDSDHKATDCLAKEKHIEVDLENENKNQVPENNCEKRVESFKEIVDFNNKGIGYKPKLNDHKVNLETDYESSNDKKQDIEQIIDEISESQFYPYLKFDHEKDMFQCSFCNHLSLTRRNSLRHMARNHKKEIRSGLNDIITAETNDCGKSFCRKLYGNQGKKYWCTECTRFFSNVAKKEKKRYPTLKKESELCQECGKNFQNLKNHILCVHTIENVKCTKCEKAFKNPMLLKAHTDNVHEKIPCADCGKLIGAPKMWSHIQSQHTPNEDKKHKCEVCGKGFCEKERLKDHKNIHTGEKPYKCKFCSDCFASRGTHAMHERGHLGCGRKHTKK